MDYKVNEIKIVELKDISYLFIEGTLQYENVPLFSMELTINDKKMINSSSNYFNSEYTFTSDYKVNEDNHCYTFSVYSKINQKIKYVSLCEADTKIIEITSTEIEKYITDNPILYKITNVSYDGNNKIRTVSGWSYSLDLKEVKLQVYNHGTLLNYTMHKTIQRDLVDKGIVSYSNSMCGFEINFVDDGKSESVLEFYCGNYKKSFYLGEDKNKKHDVITSLIRNVNLETIQKAIKYLKSNGLSGLMNRLAQGYQNPADYNSWFLCHKVSAKTQKMQKEVCWKYSPKISILVPTYNTPENLLVEMLESVLHQTYSNWELCIADASDDKKRIPQIINKFVSDDQRVIVNSLNYNLGIAKNTNEALQVASGEYIGLLDHDDFLEEDALFEIVKALNEVKYDCLYTDEDKYNMDSKKFEDPNFKPDFSIDSLRSHNYITHFFVAKSSIVKQVGGERSEYDGAQDYDLILRCIENSKAIGHISKILYHWRIHPGSTAGNPESKMYCYEAGRKAIADHLVRVGLSGTVSMLGKPYWGLYHTKYNVIDNPLVSVIIPNYENKKVLERCVNSLLNINLYKNIEIIIVENNSHSEEIFKYYSYLENNYKNIHVVTWSGGDFNYSAINNYGVKHSSGEYLLLLNNDTEVVEPDSIEEMLGMCQREDVGAVGAKLLYPDNTVQHAGVVIGFGGVAGHVFSRINKVDPGYMMRALVNYNYSAVTAACMMTKRTLYEKVNGMDEDLKVAFNDVDYCLKIRALNKLVVYNAFSVWWHYESVSRGYEKDMEKIGRYNSEVNIFQKKWRDILINGDPYYNRNFTDDAHQFEVN